MKKLCVLAILIVALIAFAACGGADEPEPAPAAAEDAAEDPAEPDVPPAEDHGEEEPEVPFEAPVVIAERGEDVVYSLASDYYFQNMPVGTSGTDEAVLTTEYLMGAGTPTFEVIALPLGGRGVRLTNRDETWHAVDIVTSAMGLDTEAYSYALTIYGNISQAGNVNVGGGDSPYSTLFSAASPAGDFTLTGTVTASTMANSGERGHFRVSVNNLQPFEIHGIEFRRIDLVEPFEVPERPENVLYSLRTDAYVQGRVPGDTGNGAAIFGGTPYLVDSGNPIFSIVAHPSGDASRAIRVSNRAADWHTLDINLDAMGLDFDANSYTIRAAGVIIDPPEGSTADIMGTSDPWGRFGYVEVGEDGEFAIEGVLSAESMEENGAFERVRIAASAEAGEAVFYIYELEITKN